MSEGEGGDVDLGYDQQMRRAVFVGGLLSLGKNCSKINFDIIGGRSADVRKFFPCSSVVPLANWSCRISAVVVQIESKLPSFSSSSCQNFLEMYVLRLAMGYCPHTELRKKLN